MKLKKLLIHMTLVVGLAAVVSLAFGLQNSSQHKVLFEKAKFTMETKGDLDGAIDLFKQIINKYPNERDYAAKSLYLIGTCYEKLGEKQAQQAQAAYQRIVKDYPDQTEAVSMAKEKLLVYQKAQVPAVAGEDEFRIQKVFDFKTWGSPSLDGRLISCRDDSGDLVIIDIISGKRRRLTANASWDKGDFVSTSEISPDNGQVAYAWCQDFSVLALKVSNLDGSGVRVLHSGKMEPREKSEYFWPCDWMSDGQSILGFLDKEERRHIAFMSAADGSLSVVESFKIIDRIYPEVMRLSPDGRWIACDCIQDESSGKYDIILIAADGSQKIPLVKHPGNDRLLDWTPGGDSVLIASDRSGSWDAWIVPIKDGAAQGEPILVKSDFGQVGGPTGVSPLGFTHDGSFYYGVQSLTEDVYITALSMDEPEILVPPKKISQHFEGSNCYADWSPDGKFLAYISRRDPGAALCVLAVDTGEYHEILPELGAGMIRLNWFPDGQSVLVVGSDQDGRRGIFRVDINTGDVSPIVTEGQGFHCPRCTPDGKYMFYEVDSWDDRIFKIMRYDFAAGKSQEFYRSSSQIIRMDVSPDGELLAFPEWAVDKALKIIPVKGGKPQSIHKFEEGTWCTSVAWSPNGNDLFISKVPEGEDKRGRIELWRISKDGGKPVKYPLVVNGMGDLCVHPDGRRLAFSDLKVDYATYVMENFLPKAQTGKGSK